MAPPMPSIVAATSIRSVARPSSKAFEIARSFAAGRATTTAAAAVASDRVDGRPSAASRSSVPRSRTAMKRHGWSLLLLPDQRATSVIANSSSSVSGSGVCSRTWWVRSSGRTASMGEGSVGSGIAAPGGSGLGHPGACHERR